MATKTKKVNHKIVAFEPDKVMLMVAIVSVLTLVLFGALTAL